MEDDVYENFVCKLASILLRAQCVQDENTKGFIEYSWNAFLHRLRDYLKQTTNMKQEVSFRCIFVFCYSLKHSSLIFGDNYFSSFASGIIEYVTIAEIYTSNTYQNIVFG